jgi:predicted  nucleic acid-binding Zn-ribbon protein
VEVSVADPTSEELELLLELQATDHSVRKARHQLDELPEQQLLEEALARAGTLEREHDDVRVELERASARQRQLEREVEVLTQRRDAERARLYDGSVVNARELKAVEAEIETTVRRIDEHEELLLEVLEQVDALETRAADLVIAGDQVRSRATELEQERDEAAKHVLAELAELEADRERRATQLPADLLTRYEAAAARAGGTGVGKLVDNACTACRLTMSRADVGELLAGPPLTTCPQCRRLLVVPS